MKAPLSWLAEYVDVPDSLDDLVSRLIMSGTEVEDIVRIGENWQDIIVGLVARKEIPSGSKHLSVVTIDIDGSSVVAVTGAPDIEEGQKVPIVRLGGVVPRGPDGEPFTLQPRKMLGITGEAMVLSERELGMSEEHGGILVLPDDAKVGSPLAELLGETIIDVEAKGRSDEQSILGVAREAAAVTRTELREPPTSRPRLASQESSPSAHVTVDAPELCPRYSAIRVDGITIQPSPSWLARRLESAGIRSISNVVDVTNYVMLELGQPLHAFDYDAIPIGADGYGKIIVRRSKPGETIVTLDGVERTMPPDTLLITDIEGPTGIAGVMGGGKSEIHAGTTSILLEAANFDRVSVRRTSRALGLRTEASARFERGVPPELTEIALARCVHLFGLVCPDALTVYQLVDVKAAMPEPPQISFTEADIRRLLGVEVQLGEAVESLKRLGFETRAAGDVATAVPPYWRRDVENTADICEEVARMIGYDAIPETLPGQETQPVGLPPDLRWENAVRDALWAVGLSEAWTDTLTSPESLARVFPPADASELDWSRIIAAPAGVIKHGARIEVMALANAPTSERSAIRISLLPSLLDVVAGNLKHTHDRIAFFELARTFFPRDDDLPYERRTVGIALAGDRLTRSWNRPERAYDFFDLKGFVIAMLTSLGFQAEDVMVSAPEPESVRALLHPGRSARVSINGADAGFLGELHPLVAEAFEIEETVRAYVAELDLDWLIAHAQPKLGYRPISRYPAVRRDISLTFPAGVQAGSVEQAVEAAGGPLLRYAKIVDVYQSVDVGVDRKSIALTMEFQSDENTLTQEHVSEIQAVIVSRLESSLKGELRG